MPTYRQIQKWRVAGTLTFGGESSYTTQSPQVINSTSVKHSLDFDANLVFSGTASLISFAVWESNQTNSGRIIIHDSFRQTYGTTTQNLTADYDGNAQRLLIYIIFDAFTNECRLSVGVEVTTEVPTRVNGVVLGSENYKFCATTGELFVKPLPAPVSFYDANMPVYVYTRDNYVDLKRKMGSCRRVNNQYSADLFTQLLAIGLDGGNIASPRANGHAPINTTGVLQVQIFPVP